MPPPHIRRTIRRGQEKVVREANRMAASYWHALTDGTTAPSPAGEG